MNTVHAVFGIVVNVFMLPDTETAEAEDNSSKFAQGGRVKYPNQSFKPTKRTMRGNSSLCAYEVIWKHS